MCSIHIDESVTRVDYCMVVTSSVYIFFEKLNSLLDRLDNRCMIHDSRSDTFKWVCRSRKYVHCCSGVTLHGL
jgi:hypothetical protein